MLFASFLAMLLIAIATISPRTRRVEWDQTIDHDPKCYTQGLSFINSTHILESCGMYR